MFNGIVRGQRNAAGVVGDIGVNHVSLAGDIFASVTSLAGAEQAAAVCYSNASGAGDCNVTGSVRVSGTYEKCPGAGTASSDAC